MEAAMSIFDMGRHGDSGNTAGFVSEIATLDESPNRQIITAVRTQSGTLRLISWRVNANGSVIRLGDSGNQAGAASSISIARGSRIVVACRTSSGNLRLISWNVTSAGAVSRGGDSGNQAGNASLIRLAAVTDALFLTALRAGNGRLMLISWRLNSNGSLTRLADSGSAAGSVGEVSLIRLSPAGGTNRVLTSVRTSDGNLKLIAWRISSSGSITRAGDSGNAAGRASMICATTVSTSRVVTSVRTGGGDLKLISWGISSNGGTIQRLGDSGSAAGAIGSNSLAKTSNGVVSAVRTSSGALKLISWSVNANGSITRRSDSGSQAGTASLVNISTVQGVNNISFVTPVRTAGDNLKLISWGRAAVRMHIKIIREPTNFTIDQMVAGMRQVFASVGIDVHVITTETLTLPATFLDIDVGSCTMGNVTAEQTQLFNNRNSVGANDVVVYFVRSTVPPFNGCAAHPNGRPGAVVAAGASRWTLGHEIGHVLGLRHVNDNRRLMTGNGTGNIIDEPPDLIASEASTIQSSRLTVPT
jgi:hypothetical protein